MRENIRRGLMIILGCTCIGSLGMFFYQRELSRRADATYEAAKELANVPELSEFPEPTDESEEKVKKEPTHEVWQEVPILDDPYMEALKEIDLAALREVNPDVLGWIMIPETKMSYPIVKGEDNEFYLNHTWEGKKSSVGAVFMEQTNPEDFSNFNTILYAHRMIDGSMFGLLKYYKKQDYFEKHPYIYVYDDQGSHRYEVFAAYEAAIDSEAYRVGLNQEKTKKKFLKECAGYSVIETGVEPTLEDRILTLSTCTGRGYENRWVVQARRKGTVSLQ